ncbi:MAG: DUF4382 domain-containing protein [Cyanobacteria bacterium J06641_5]
MKLRSRSIFLIGLSTGFALITSCAQPESTEETDPTQPVAAGGPGTLRLVANGEDFVRQGFTTKDGWRIDFDRVAVTLSDVEAYQTEPSFDPDSADPLQATQTVSLVDAPKTIDLAAGDATAPPILVVETSAPAGLYNALAWQIITDGDSKGIVIKGIAKKEERTVDFTLNLDTELAYVCGEYVGDDRKGFLAPEDSTELEATFHFDHIFGDGEAPADDEINTGALGFTPLANVAAGDILNVDLATLQTSLTPVDYETLETAIAGLGHVGEGHCRLLKADG